MVSRVKNFQFLSKILLEKLFFRNFSIWLHATREKNPWWKMRYLKTFDHWSFNFFNYRKKCWIWWKLLSTRLLGNEFQAHLSPYDWPLVNNWLPTIEIWRGETQRKEDSMSHRGFLPPTFNSRATPKLGLIGFFSSICIEYHLFSHPSPIQLCDAITLIKKCHVTLTIKFEPIMHP